MESWKRLLLANQAWVQEKLLVREDYFMEMAKGQTPEFLWIGCSDSRVPPEEITGTSPGELFVHRNVANLVVHNDFNLLAVLQYAVEALNVPNIVVCGHYGCGGVMASMARQDLGLLNHWLRHIKDVYRLHRDEVELHGAETARVNRLVELNVLEQVQNLLRTSIIQRAWERGDGPVLHGWVYNLSDGRLQQLIKVEPGAHVDDVFRFVPSQAG
ncbi:MAG: carbonic anhydrase [Alphaproteobacteria bacterium]|nr:carbonic anhydrase [Alphaproteobacteria bacterium]